MKKNNLLVAAAAFLLCGVLAGPSGAKSTALDQLKAEAESLAATPAAPAQTPAAAPASQSLGASTPAQPPAAVPVQEASLSDPEGAAKDIKVRISEAVGHFVYRDLIPRLEPKGDHHLEAALSRMMVRYIKVFDKKECPLSLPLGNLREIAPGVYRSAFPTQEGFTQLKQQMGVKTVLSLLQPGETQGMSVAEDRTVADLGMSYADVPIDWTIWPTFQQIDQALDIMADPSKQPVLLHCTCGDDRTGIVSATYRVAVQGWTPEKAAAEAKTFYWHLPAFGDLTDFLSSYARYRAGKVSAPPAPAA